MAERSYLKNIQTGVVFPYTALLAKNGKNLVPSDKDGNTGIDEVDATGVDSVEGVDFDLENATKPQMVEHAANFYGETLNERQTKEEMREQLRKIIEAAG